MTQDILSPDSIWFVVTLIAFVALIIAAFILPAYVQHIITQRKRKKNIFPLPAPSFRGKTWVGVIGTTAFIFGLIFLLIFSSCSPRITAMNTQGKLLKSEPDRVYGIFEDMMGKPGYYAGEWFYFPGLGLINVDDYRLRVILEKIR